MVLSNAENQIGLIMCGCVSGADLIIFNSNDSKKKYLSKNSESCTMQFAWQHHAKQGLESVLEGKQDWAEQENLRSACPGQVN